MPTYYVRSDKDYKVSLSDSDYVASGGEKKVYAKSGIAYCIYHNPVNAIPVSKIDELSAVKHNGFIAPQSLLLDSTKNRVGETMPFIKDSFVLCQLFAKSFRKAKSVDHSVDIEIYRQMFEVRTACHKAGVVMVDPNDMNWLVSKDLKTVYLIDTTSCKTPSHQATAIKPAIFDPHCGKVFTAESDHYSLAVLVAWLWVGLHPFCCPHRGNKMAMPEKMLNGISVFSKDAQLNTACRDPKTMPSELRQWCRETLETRNRPEPPKSITGAVGVSVSVPAAIVAGIKIKRISKATKQSGVVAVDTALNRTVIYDKGFIQSNGKKIKAQFDHAFARDGKLYACSANVLMAIDVREVNGELRISNKVISKLSDLPHATLYGDGCVIQDLLGRKVVSTPDGSFVLDLKKKRVLSAVYKRDVLMLSVVASGVASMHTYVIKAGQVVSEQERVLQSPAPANFVVTRRGVVIENRDGTLVAWSRTDKSKTKQASIDANMVLQTDGDSVQGVLNNEKFSINMS